jgi:opacity protein-like surface antigen
MKLKSAFIALGALAAASSPAGADGMKDMAVPAPIPVAAPIPVPEGFSYYLRADIGWGWAKTRSFSETGAVYGEDSLTGPFTSSAIPFSSGNEGTFGGTIGFGAYLAPRIRGDLTLDFRQDKLNVFSGNYAYAPSPGFAVAGSVQDSLKVSSAVGLVNGYIDLLPRGFFSPYVGAGIGAVYNQITRSYLNSETLLDGTGATAGARSRVGSGKENNLDLAAALMAGVSIAFDHRWALDIGYRALYMGGSSATVTTPSFVSVLTPTQHSTATLGDTWEHQVRVGLRWNIW